MGKKFPLENALKFKEQSKGNLPTVPKEPSNLKGTQLIKGKPQKEWKPFLEKFPLCNKGRNFALPF